MSHEMNQVRMSTGSAYHDVHEEYPDQNNYYDPAGLPVRTPPLPFYPSLILAHP